MRFAGESAEDLFLEHHTAVLGWICILPREGRGVSVNGSPGQDNEKVTEPQDQLGDFRLPSLHTDWIIQSLQERPVSAWPELIQALMRTEAWETSQERSVPHTLISVKTKRLWSLMCRNSTHAPVLQARHLAMQMGEGQ